MSEVGNVVEWFEQPSSITTGIVSNATPVRRVGVVSHEHLGFWVVYDAEGIRAMVKPEKLTVIQERPTAGWAKLSW